MVALLWCLKYEGHCLKCYTHTNDLGNGVTDEVSRRNESELPFIECDVYRSFEKKYIVKKYHKKDLTKKGPQSIEFRIQPTISFLIIP